MNLQQTTRLIHEVEQHKPDIILLQEATKYPNKENIISFLQKKTKYPFASFDVAHDRSKDYGKGAMGEDHILEGLGILAKESFEKSTTSLSMLNGIDRWPRIVVLYRFKQWSLCQVHLSKYPESRKQQVKELPEADVYAGDFNMTPNELKAHFSETTSYDVIKYISFPAKQLTLDYVIARKGKIQSVKVIEQLSDHNGLLVTLHY